MILQKTKAEDVARNWVAIKNHLSSPTRCLKSNKFLRNLFQQLGLPKRKLRILQNAEKIKELEYVPDNLTDLMLLQGVGVYTACATMAFAYNKNRGLVDSNVIRFFERFWHVHDHHDLRQKVKYWLPVSKTLGGRKTFKYIYWGLLDFCAAICTPRKPRCQDCPLASRCFAHSTLECKCVHREMEHPP